MITGGAGGIGSSIFIYFLAVARKLAQRGCNLILWDINVDALEKVKNEIKELYPSIKILTYAVDVSNSGKVHETAKMIIKILKDNYVSIVFNNAGVAAKKTIMEMTDDDIDKTLSINTNAYFYVIKEFLPGLLKRNDGFLIHTSSVAGFTPAPRLVEYNASKYAVMGMHEGLMSELQILGGDNINCCCICPFFVKTPLFQNAYDKRGKNIIMDYICPVLTTDYVADEIINSIINRDRYCVIPGYLYYLVHIAKLLPYPIFNYATKLVVYIYIII